MSQPTILELADKYAKEYYMGRDEEARKRLQAAIINNETNAYSELKKVQDELEALKKLMAEHGHTFENREDGLAHCLVCGGAEGSLPTRCPGKKMGATTIEAVYRERLDFNTGPMTRDPVWWLRVDHPENIVG